MSKWDEIYGPARPLAELETRIEALEIELASIFESMKYLIFATRQTNEAVKLLTESRENG